MNGDSVRNLKTLKKIKDNVNTVRSRLVDTQMWSQGCMPACGTLDYI